jgi:hypothetical protein
MPAATPGGQRRGAGPGGTAPARLRAAGGPGRRSGAAVVFGLCRRWPRRQECNSHVRSFEGAHVIGAVPAHQCRPASIPQRPQD